MKKWTMVLGGFLLVLSFQNCQQSKLPGDTQSSTSPANSQEYQKSSTSGFPTLQLWDYDKGKTIDVDVSTGKMSVFLNYGNDRADDLCLNESERDQLQKILSAAEVCKPVLAPEVFLDKQCTQLYRYPYAILVDRGTELRLGEKTNGCDVPTDLCGTQSQVLKDFVQHVLTTLDQKSCQ